MTGTRPPDRPALIDALREVYGPCCADRGISIVDMGVVEDVRVDAGRVEVDLVLTTGWCPFLAAMSDAIPERLRAVAGVPDVHVQVAGTRSGPRSACRPGPARSSRSRSRRSSPAASVGSPSREEPEMATIETRPGDGAARDRKVDAFVFDCAEQFLREGVGGLGRGGRRRGS